MDTPATSAMRMFYNEHAVALWRYVYRLTGDRARADAGRLNETHAPVVLPA